MNESYNPGSDHEQRDLPELSPTTDHQQRDTPEGYTPGNAPVNNRTINNGAGAESAWKQREHLAQASQIASRWIIALKHGLDDPTMSALADRIIELSADYRPDVSQISIADLEFSNGTHCSLNHLEIRTVGDLLPWNYQKLVRTRGSTLGVRRVEEIRAKLGTIGVTLPDK